ncbi:MAG: class II aldolase/adducin family protein [[Eubacterium] sulci]|nr:class II aldolase/adducin family protein [[Eubacterium] sulci]
MRKNDEWQSRRSMAEYGRKLLELGLVQGTWGNISVRLSANYMLVTPSGLDYKMIDGSDMVKVAIKTLTYGDGNVPTTEKGLHAGIYESRSDIGAIIHTHSKYCSIFAAARKPLQVLDEELAKITGELIYISDYAYAGSRKLTKKCREGTRRPLWMHNIKPRHDCLWQESSGCTRDMSSYGKGCRAVHRD